MGIKTRIHRVAILEGIKNLYSGKFKGILKVAAEKEENLES